MMTIRQGKENRIRSKVLDKRGMTMGELLIVVAIIVILAGVAFIAVINYQRTLAQFERDRIAKELFIAAQNHLTVAKGEGYLNSNSADKVSFGEEDPSDSSVHYYVVNGSIPNNDDTLIGQMLPFGSVDEQVRMGGSYIIRYDASAGKVLDVFYCSRSGSPAAFNHKLLSTEYNTVIGLRDDENTNNKDSRRTCSLGSDSKCVLGWYGGADVETLEKTIEAPDIKVVNAEKLYVLVKENNEDRHSLRILIKGKMSDAEHYLDVYADGFSFAKYDSGEYSGYYKQAFVLDDITAPVNEYMHIATRQFDDMKTRGNNNQFIPGEDLIVSAVAYDNNVLSNIAYSREVTENSLFASASDGIDEVGNGSIDTAYIANIRHLENLDDSISGVNVENLNITKVFINYAEQTKDLDWNDFLTAIRDGNESKVVTVYGYKDDTVGAGNNCYRPIDPSYTDSIDYDGAYYKISNIVASAPNAGLFGSAFSGDAVKVTSVENVELIDFNITSADGSAGALGGNLKSVSVTNVLARNTSNDTISNKITGATAGGLIGSLTDGSVEYSAAAMIVNGSGTAGGLIGSASGSTTIKGSYSGGHTKGGSYLKWIYTDGDRSKAKVSGHDYDVTGATAGGLVGSSSATIEDSYSTCSVSGTAKAGGFAGVAGGSIKDCYSTGLLDVSDVTDNSNPNNGKIGAFAGSMSGSATNCKYFSIINEVMLNDKLDHYLKAVGDNDNSNISELDENAGEYDKFVGGAPTKNAKVYDDTGDNNLKTIYNGKYVLKPIDEISTDDPLVNSYYVNAHYGDWPAPEVFVINN